MICPISFVFLIAVFSLCIFFRNGSFWLKTHDSNDFLNVILRKIILEIFNGIEIALKLPIIFVIISHKTSLWRMVKQILVFLQDHVELVMVLVLVVDQLIVIVIIIVLVIIVGAA